MKKILFRGLIIVISVILMLSLLNIFVDYVILDEEDRRLKEQYSGKFAYPLENLSDTEDGEYWLIREENTDPGFTSIIVDYDILKENKNLLKMYNTKRVYQATTNANDCEIRLYKDGKQIGWYHYGSSFLYTPFIEWGDLEEHFIDYNSISEEAKDEFFNMDKGDILLQVPTSLAALISVDMICRTMLSNLMEQKILNMVMITQELIGLTNEQIL